MPENGDSPELDKKNKRKPAKKSDDSEVARRVEEVVRIILDGAQHWDVLQYASEKGWGVSERQVRTYIARAHEILVEQQEKDREKVIARHLSQRQALFARAVNAADLRTALSVLDSEAKLRGLFPEQVAKNKEGDATAKPSPLIIISGPTVIAPPPDEPEVSADGG